MADTTDVPAMEHCRARDPVAGPADPRMAAYLGGHHHPQQALAPRTAFVALVEDNVVGYIAGHATRRHGCTGEVQYLYVAPPYRRCGVASSLLRCIAEWFQTQHVRRVCVNADVESAGAVAFYTAQGAVPLNKHWYIWEDIGSVFSREG